MKPLTGLPVDAFVRVAQESGIPLKGLLELVQQVENGASVAFLARYRADLCGGLDEERVHAVFSKLEDQKALIDHRISMLTTLGQRGVLTPELKRQLEQAGDRQELNDIFAPYRARKSGPADKAVEMGLDPLARVLWFQEAGVDIQAEAAKYVDSAKGIGSTEESLEGAYAIAARWLSEKPEVLRELRKVYRQNCETVVSTSPSARKEPRYQALDGLSAKTCEIPWQKRLAIRRGVRAGLLEAKTEFPAPPASEYLERCLIKEVDSPYTPHLKSVVETTLSNGLIDRLRTDVMRQLEEETDNEAIEAYRKALRELLLAPVAHELNIVGLETGRPGGWRAALIDGNGDVIDYAIVRADESEGRTKRNDSKGPAAVSSDVGSVVASAGTVAAMSAPPLPSHDESAARASATEAPESGASTASADAAAADPGGTTPAEVAASTGPPAESADGPRQSRPLRSKARRVELSEILVANDVDLIVFPAGPRQRLTEKFLRAQIRRSGKSNIGWIATRDSGTWIYATSKAAKRESPHLEPAVRSAVSLARRVQDPMAELVKTDLRSIGIGANYHEVDPERLRTALSLTLDRTVHDVGVDLNRAPVALLTRVPGLTERLARRIVAHRKKNGVFRTRRDVLNVEGLTESIYAQAVGFLRVYAGDLLDATGAHPEYSALYEEFAGAAGCDFPTLVAEPERLEGLDPEQFATSERPVVQVRFAMEELHPSRRQARARLAVPEPVVRLRSEEDLRPGSKVSGVVASIADFGAFVDIGGDQDGLLHISQIRREQLKDSKPDLQIGDAIDVFIKAVDQASGRIRLTMWDPRSRPPRPEGRRRDWSRERGERRSPVNRSFGPDRDKNAQHGRSKLSREQKLAVLEDKYRTKV